MSFDLSQIACDPEALEKGVEVEVYRGWKWRVASARRRDFERAILLAAQSEEKAKPEERDKALVAAYAEHVLLGWDEAELDGAPFPYSKENAAKLLADPRFPDALELLRAVARNLDNFREQAETEAKNG